MNLSDCGSLDVEKHQKFGLAAMFLSIQPAPNGHCRQSIVLVTIKPRKAPFCIL